MKLLFDENVSPKLAAMLADEYPGSRHVVQAGLHGAEDRVIWDYARENGFAIVSKDTDFRERSIVEGFPPKIIWLDVGNAGTAAIAGLLRREQERVGVFEKEKESSFLLLSLTGDAVKHSPISKTLLVKAMNDLGRPFLTHNADMLAMVAPQLEAELSRQRLSSMGRHFARRMALAAPVRRATARLTQATPAILVSDSYRRLRRGNSLNQAGK